MEKCRQGSGNRRKACEEGEEEAQKTEEEGDEGEEEGAKRARWRGKSVPWDRSIQG